MYYELLFFSYVLVGILVFVTYRKDVHEHVAKNAASSYIKRIIYIVAFLATIVAWPLLIGA